MTIYGVITRDNIRFSNLMTIFKFDSSTIGNNQRNSWLNISIISMILVIWIYFTIFVFFLLQRGGGSISISCCSVSRFFCYKKGVLNCVCYSVYLGPFFYYITWWISCKLYEQFLFTWRQYLWTNIMVLKESNRKWLWFILICMLPLNLCFI